MKKRFYGYLISLVFVLAAVFSAHALTTEASAATRYCNDNSIIRCGALTPDELQQKYTANQGNLKAIYSHYGISSSMITNASSAKSGVVTKNGDVIVDGKVVATGAESTGRHYVNGSKTVKIGSTTVYQRATQAVFIVDQDPAYVWLDKDGKFLAAVIKSCGNPVVATPKPPEKPKPQPAATCVDLKSSRIEKDRYRLSATASTSNGATISSYVFTVRKDDANGQVLHTATVASTAKSASTNPIRLAPGTYFASVTVKTSVGYKTHANCTTSFSVPKPKQVEVCEPKTGETITVDKDKADNYPPVDSPKCKDIEVCELETKDIITIRESEFDSDLHSRDLDDCKEEETPPVIPSTGPAEFIGGGLALGSLTAAGYYWNSSRRTLLGKLLNR